MSHSRIRCCRTVGHDTCCMHRVEPGEWCAAQDMCVVVLFVYVRSIATHLSSEENKEEDETRDSEHEGDRGDEATGSEANGVSGGAT